MPHVEEEVEDDARVDLLARNGHERVCALAEEVVRVRTLIRKRLPGTGARGAQEGAQFSGRTQRPERAPLRLRLPTAQDDAHHV